MTSTKPSAPWWKRALAWIEAKWHYVAVAVVGLVGAAIGFKSLRERNEERLDAKARREVERARKQLAALHEARAELKGRVDARQEEIDLVEAHLATTRRVIVQAYEETQELSDEDVLGRFKALGYE